jgi:cytoskeletal protein RodZ
VKTTISFSLHSIKQNTFSRSLYAVVILLVLIATIQDFFAKRKTEEPENVVNDEQAESDQKESDEEQPKSDPKKGG